MNTGHLSSRSFLLASLAGLALASTALAATPVAEPAPIRAGSQYDGVFRLDPSTRQFVLQPGSPQTRVAGIVYDNTRAVAADACGALNVTGMSSLGDDLDMNAGGTGPWAGKTNNLLTRFTWLLRNAAGTQLLDAQISFYRNHDYSAAVMLENAEFIGGGRFGFGAAGIPTGTFVIDMPADEFFPAAGGVLLPDDQIFALVEYVIPGTNNLVAPGQMLGFQFTNLSTGTTTPSPRIGATTPDMATESGAAANLNGGFAAEDLLTGTGATDRVTLILGPAGIGNPAVCQNVTMHPAFELEGELGATPPATITDLGALNDGPQSVSGSLNNDVKWYKVRLNGDATDFARGFLDIDTAGSSGDVAIALYHSNGRVAGSVLGTGNTGISDVTGSPDQLSYGIGRRNGPSGGVQFAGQSGQVFEGDFYLAVAPAGSLFAGDFGVFAGAGSSAFTLNLNTNTNFGALDPVVPPVVVQDLGTLPGSNGLGGPGNVLATAAPTGLAGIVWYKFTLASDVSVAANQFLDIDFTNSTPNTNDLIAFIFNDQGVAQIVSDDRGPLANSPGAFLPQLSLGAPGPRGPYDAPNDAVFNGDPDLDLAAGTYYLAVAQLDTVVAPQIDRFHLRWDGLETDRVDTNVQVRFVSNAGPGVPTCPADLDNDGDFANGGNTDGGVDVNDLLYFLVGFEAGDAAVDLDNDGDPAVGTPDGGVDVNDLLFFLIRFEQGC